MVWQQNVLWMQFKFFQLGQCVIDGIFQLVDVVGLVVVGKYCIEIGREFWLWDFLFVGKVGYEQFCQWYDVLWVIVQWWQIQCQDVEVIVEIFVEKFFLYQFDQVFLCCVDYLYIDVYFMIFVNVVEGVVVEKVQQFGLYVW